MAVAVYLTVILDCTFIVYSLMINCHCTVDSNFYYKNLKPTFHQIFIPVTV